jgi:hypothetical protein
LYVYGSGVFTFVRLWQWSVYVCTAMAVECLHLYVYGSGVFTFVRLWQWSVYVSPTYDFWECQHFARSKNVEKGIYEIYL